MKDVLKEYIRHVLTESANRQKLADLGAGYLRKLLEAEKQLELLFDLIDKEDPESVAWVQGTYSDLLNRRAEARKKLAQLKLEQ